MTDLATDINVGDYVVYNNTKQTSWRVERISQFVYVIRSGQSGKCAWARREDLKLHPLNDKWLEVAA